MSYVDKVLQPGEQVGYQAALTGSPMCTASLWLLAAALVWMILPAAVARRS